MNGDSVWLKTPQEKLDSLLADEAKVGPMLVQLQNTIRQLQAKHTFRLALINQLQEELLNQTK